MIIHQMEQGTLEWLAIRKGKITASNATAIGNCGKGLDTYILELMSEYYSSGERVYYTNADIERGNELEELAASMYEMEIGVVLEKVGFVEYNEFVGCSPDRFCGEHGLLEIKCLNDKNHFKILLEGEKAIDSAYLWQVQMQLLITKRLWADLVFYNPNFKKSLSMFRIEPCQTKQVKLLEGFAISEAKIKSIKNQF